MTNDNGTDPPASVRSTDAVDPLLVLESLASELEYLLLEAPAACAADLVHLHGALLVYDLDGHGDRLPSPRFGLSARCRRERGIVQAARRIVARGGDAAATKEIAADEVAHHVYLIDPELGTLAA